MEFERNDRRSLSFLIEKPMTTQAAPQAQQTSWLRTAWNDWQSPFHWMAVLLILTLFVVEAALARAVHFSGISEIFACWPSVLLCIICIGYARWRPLPRGIESTELVLLAIVFTNILTILIQLAGRSPYPLYDAQLTAIDRAARFSTVDWVHLITRYPTIRITLAVAYDLVTPLIFLALFVPPFFGHRSASRRFILGIVLAAIVTAVVFWRWPAVGPWTMEGYAPSQEQAAVAAYLLRLRSPFPVQADMVNAGIVSFPSFHTVLAVMAAFALRGIRILWVAAWIICGLICISTITTGWHYGIDVIAGLVLSVVSMTAVAWVE